MATWLSKADAMTAEFVMDVSSKYHRPLIDAEVTIGVLFHDDPDRVAQLDDRLRPVPLLKHKGYPAAATVEVTPYKKRVQGLPDAVITLDKGLWSHLKPAEREALIDHELQHLEVQEDEESGEIKRDLAGRPKLRLRLHDVQLGVFDAVIRRHGNAALDTQVVRACHERYRQTCFAWGDDHAEQDQPPDGPRMTEGLRDAAGTSPDVVRDTFTALLSVGHTESQARAMIDNALASGKRFGSVAEMMDAIYDAQPVPDPDDWRNLSLCDLLDGKTSDALGKAGLVTLGDLADYTASGKRLTAIKGITAKRAEAIDAATAAFWAAKGPDSENEPRPGDDSDAA